MFRYFSVILLKPLSVNRFMAMQSLMNSVFGSQQSSEDQKEKEIEKIKNSPRVFTKQQVIEHDGKEGRAFYAVIDGFVVDATEFLKTHPGGLKKLLSSNNAAIGWTGKPFGFSMSRGRNAHLYQTQQTFNAAIKRFESGGGKEVEVTWQSLGKIVILGKFGE